MPGSVCILVRMLYNSTNHGVICTDHAVEYTDHVVVCTSHVDLLEIDQVASMFVYGKNIDIKTKNQRNDTQNVDKSLRRQKAAW